MRAVLMLTLVALAFTGCTGDDGVDYVVPDQDDEGRYVIEMTSNFRFIPENAEVPVGATVLWKNVGGAHNVVAEDDAWEAGPVTDEDFELVVTEAMVGTHDYYCQPHQSLGMVGTLRVVEA